MGFRLYVFLFNLPFCSTLLATFSFLYQDKLATLHYQVESFPHRMNCALHCYQTASCLSFTYEEATQKCFLYNRVLREEEESIPDNGLVTFVLNTENIAFQKPTEQSSTTNYRTPSRIAVDGRISGGMAHTNHETQTWWCVDLQSNYDDIGNIVIYNRMGEFDWRIRNFRIRLSDKGDCTASRFEKSRLCYSNDGEIKNVYSISECNQPTSFRNIRSIFIDASNTSLNIREVEVYRSIRCPYIHEYTGYIHE